MNSAMPWLGAALVVVGLVWMAQGFGWVGGSAMSGDLTWAVIGPLVAIGGAGIVYRSFRPRG